MKDRIASIIENLTDDEQVQVHTEYCDANNDYDSIIYSMDMFDDLMGGYTPTEIANRIFYGDFKPYHEWFCFNGYANLESSDWISDLSVFCPSDIADYIVDNDEDFGVSAIREALDEIEEEE